MKAHNMAEVSRFVRFQAAKRPREPSALSLSLLAAPLSRVRSTSDRPLSVTGAAVGATSYDTESSSSPSDAAEDVPSRTKPPRSAGRYDGGQSVQVNQGHGGTYLSDVIDTVSRRAALAEMLDSVGRGSSTVPQSHLLDVLDSVSRSVPMDMYQHNARTASSVGRRTLHHTHAHHAMPHSLAHTTTHSANAAAAVAHQHAYDTFMAAAATHGGLAQTAEMAAYIAIMGDPLHRLAVATSTYPTAGHGVGPQEQFMSLGLGLGLQHQQQMMHQHSQGQLELMRSLGVQPLNMQSQQTSAQTQTQHSPHVMEQGSEISQHGHGIGHPHAHSHNLGHGSHLHGMMGMPLAMPFDSLHAHLGALGQPHAIRQANQRAAAAAQNAAASSGAEYPLLTSLYTSHSGTDESQGPGPYGGRREP
jgi:hypothetical protein